MKLNRIPTPENIIVVLDKDTDDKGAMIDPQRLGKTDSLGTIVRTGVNVPPFYTEGAKVFLPQNQQTNTFTYDGNTFCVIHYSYITTFIVDEYDDKEYRQKQREQLSAFKNSLLKNTY